MITQVIDTKIVRNNDTNLLDFMRNGNAMMLAVNPRLLAGMRESPRIRWVSPLPILGPTCYLVLPFSVDQRRQPGKNHLANPRSQTSTSPAARDPRSMMEQLLARGYLPPGAMGKISSRPPITCCPSDGIRQRGPPVMTIGQATNCSCGVMAVSSAWPCITVHSKVPHRFAIRNNGICKCDVSERRGSFCFLRHNPRAYRAPQPIAGGASIEHHVFMSSTTTLHHPCSCKYPDTSGSHKGRC